MGALPLLVFCSLLSYMRGRAGFLQVYTWRATVWSKSPDTFPFSLATDITGLLTGLA